MSVFEMLKQQLTGEPSAQLADQLGMERGETEKAIGSVLPTLLTAMAGNASRGSGGSALAAALDRDHDGSILDDVTGFLKRGDDGDGEGILRHVLGDRRATVEAEVAKEAGLTPGAVGSLLPKLAPLVMGALGREKRARGLDAGGLVNLVAREGREARSAMPAGLSLLGSMLDQDGDGLDMDDLAKGAKGILGKMF